MILSDRPSRLRDEKMMRTNLLESAIQHSISTLNFKNAVFLAQRYLCFTQSHTTSPEYINALFLLSVSHLHANQPLYALHILEGEYKASPSLMYLYGQACLALKRYPDGERVLRNLICKHDPFVKENSRAEQSGNTPAMKDQLSLSGHAMTSGLDWSAVHALHGVLSRKLNRTDEAIEAFKRSIELNPLNFTSYQALCELGAHVDPQTLFCEAALERVWQPTASSENVAQSGEVQANKKQNRGVSESTVPKRPVKSGPKPTTKNTRLTTANSTNVLRPAAVGRKRTHEGLPVNGENPNPDREAGKNNDLIIPLAHISSVLSGIGSGYSLLARYKCKSAIQKFSSLPDGHRDAVDIQSAIAKAHFENTSYQKAHGIFSRLHKAHPYRIEDMDIYGTCLWHLKSKNDLSFLAKQMKEMNRLSPETWCVVGNFFSLNQEHDQAIRAFQRAIQLDEEFEYAHTLLGHEYLSNEDVDHALTSFRKAAQLNPRHYNALYGLGLIYSKQQKYAQAEFHFRRALSLHPEHPVLLCLTGSVVQKDPTRLAEAFEHYAKAEKVAPKHPLYKLYKSQLLNSMGKTQDALKGLEEVIKMAQPEASVYFELGLLYRKIGNVRKALESFTCAMDFHQMSHFHGSQANGAGGILLDPSSLTGSEEEMGLGSGGMAGAMISHSKLNHMMKEAIESLFRPDVSDDDEEDQNNTD